MPNPIQPLFNGATGTVTPASAAITLAGLASSTAGVGRQSDLIDFQTSRPVVVTAHLKVTLGTTPVAGGVSLWWVGDDGAGNRDDSAGTVDAGLTVLNAVLVMSMVTKASPATGDVLVGHETFEPHTPKGAFVVTHSTGVTLASGQITYNYQYPQIG